MIRIKCSWLILSDSHCYIAYFVLSQFHVNLWQDFISILYVQVWGVGSCLLVPGSLCTTFSPSTFGVHDWGKRAIFCHDSDSHIPVIHSANALMHTLFYPQSMPSQFFFFWEKASVMCWKLHITVQVLGGIEYQVACETCIEAEFRR